jgi:hypothetical protein
MDAERLRQELTELRARIKSQSEWSSMQDRLEQRAIQARIRMLESNLNSEGEKN